MSEQINENPQYPEQLSDVLLVMDKDKKKIQAVTGIDKNGELQTVDATKKNQSQFMRVDKSGDLFSNFFSNFWRQLKDPSHFNFFKVPATEAVDTAKNMQKQLDSPTIEGEAVLSKHEVKEPKEQQENKNETQVTEVSTDKSEFRYKPEQIDWETMDNLGLGRERLEKAGVMDTLLKGYKTNILIPVSVNLGTAVTRMDARLSLQPGENGNVVVAIHGIRKEPDLALKFFGHEFTKEDKENLLKSGNMGRVVDLTNPKTGETIPSIISIDKLTKEVVALRRDWIKIPDEVKGVKLNEQQKEILLNGGSTYLEGMTTKNGKLFSAHVQYNADKRYLDFFFGQTNIIQESQSQQQSHKNGEPPFDAPRTFRGKELSDKQYEKYNAGLTVFIDGLIDKKGEKYKGYITFNKETGKEQFAFNDPNKLKEKIQTAEANKTQVAVNSDGKTNEATKSINEPLKPQQNAPVNKQQQQKQEALKPAKSKGVKR